MTRKDTDIAFEREINDPGYSYVSEDWKSKKRKFHILFMDVVLDDRTKIELNEMMKFCEWYEKIELDDDIDTLHEKEKYLLGNHILDDSFLAGIYDVKHDRWYLSDNEEFCSHEYMENLEKELDSKDLKFVSYDGWDGLERFNKLLECLKYDEMNEYKDKVEFWKLHKENW